MTVNRLTALIAALALATPAAAQVTPTVLLDDNFDSYATQEDFEAIWPRLMGGAGIPAGAPADLLPSGTLSSEQAKSPTRSIRIQADVATIPPDLNASSKSQRNSRVIEETGDPSSTVEAPNIIRFSFDFYDVLTGGVGGNPFRQHAVFQDGAGTGAGQLVALGLNNNLIATAQGGNYYMARLVGLASNEGATSAFFKLNDEGAPLRSEGWHNLAVDISDVDFKFYVDGILSETVANPATPRSYESLRIGAGFSSAGSIAFYDNFQVALNAPPIEPPPSEDADFDADGDVDGTDFLTWQQNLGALGTGTLLTGDANADTNVDDLDLGIWKTQFGQAAGVGAAGSVPEPASATLATIMLLGFARIAGRRA